MLENAINRVIWQKWSLLLHDRDMSSRPWQIFLARFLFVKRTKKHKWVTELTQGTDPWPEVHWGNCKGMFSACIGPGLHIVEWASSNERLSYFVSGHRLYSSGSRFQLSSQLSPPQTSVLLQQWSQVTNSSVLVFLSCYVLSMINFSGTRW